MSINSVIWHVYQMDGLISEGILRVSGGLPEHIEPK